MSENRLREYIENDKIYQNYKKNKKELNDFERFCFVHCEDIENVLKELEHLRRENDFLKADNIHVRQIRDNFLIDNYELENKLELAKERIAYLERSNDRREDTIISLRDELVEKGE